MPLPQGVPTLRAKRTGNLTRPDNVFCSEDFLAFFVSCDAYPGLIPGTTDHFPIISEVDLVPPVKRENARWNWREAKWEDLVQKLEGELTQMGEREAYTDLNQVLEDVDKLDGALWRCVKECVPKISMCKHSKRWWTPELHAFHAEKGKLGRRSYEQPGARRVSHRAQHVL
ncbi:hypothetical protein C8R45DRAFT_837062 [Mycena sanguinolenta]|nr:hypothetical protein C8R45DRAFT_837062 [Mycena sanguinolenta]